MKYVKFLLLRKKQQEIFETVVSLLLGNKVVEGDCLFEYEKRFHDSILTTYLGCGGEITDVDDLTSELSPNMVEMFRHTGSFTGIMLEPTDFAKEQGYVAEYYSDVEEGKQAWESCEQELFYFVEVN